MKRLLTLALLALCLAGCGATEASETLPPTEPPAPQATAAPSSAGLYDSMESLALDENGAVRCYPLDDLSPAAVRVMGRDLVLFSTGETTTLIRLSGENLYVSATAELPVFLAADAPGTQVSTKGITYYDGTSSLVFLNTDLQEVNRISLPAGIQGDPILSRDRKTLYYATADALHVISLETKLDRLLLQTSYDRLELTALHLDGTVLECQVQDGIDVFSLFLRTDTGETLYTTPGDLALHSSESLYFARLEDPAYPELLTGAPDKAPCTLETVDYKPDVTVPVMELNSLVTLVSGTDTTRLELYGLQLGDREASLTLPFRGDCRSIVGNPADGSLWMLYYCNDRNLLLRWDPTLSAVEDDTVYRLPRRTAEAPDLPGLEACAEKAGQLAKAYDVDIRIWQDALTAQPEDYRLTAEYRAPLILHSLEEIETLFASFPADFLKKLVPGKARLQLQLTGPISGLEEETALGTAMGVQFWDGESVPHVAVTLNDATVQTLIHELFHVIDSRVLSECSSYDRWNDLNPEGFDYDYSYTAHAGRADSPWLEGENRAFIDSYSMTFPREDRARIMEYAMTEDCAAYFESDAMQAKLKTLCQGIRKAFKLEKAAQDFPWEQYLTESLAYRK